MSSQYNRIPIPFQNPSSKFQILTPNAMEATENSRRPDSSSPTKPLKFSAYQNPALSAALTANSVQPSKFTFLCIFSLSSASAFAFLRILSWYTSTPPSFYVFSNFLNIVIFLFCIWLYFVWIVNLLVGSDSLGLQGNSPIQERLQLFVSFE